MLLTTLATLGSIGSSVASMIGSAKYNNANRELLAENQRLLRSRINADYTKKSQFVAGMTKQKEFMDAYTNTEQGRNSVIGGYAPSVMAQKGANARTLANMGNTLASNADAYKERAENDLMRTRNQEANLNANQANNIAQAGTTAMIGLGSLADADTGESTLDMFGLRKRKPRVRYDGELTTV